MQTERTVRPKGGTDLATEKGTVGLECVCSAGRLLGCELEGWAVNTLAQTQQTRPSLFHRLLLNACLLGSRGSFWGALHLHQLASGVTSALFRAWDHTFLSYQLFTCLSPLVTPMRLGLCTCCAVSLNTLPPSSPHGELQQGSVHCHPLWEAFWDPK